MVKRFDCILLDVVTANSPGGIDVVATNSNDIDKITEHIKGLAPNVKIEEFPTTLGRISLVDGLRRRFSKLENKDYSVALRIVQQLCLDGWEPYGNTRYYRSYGISFITMRRVSEIDN